MEKKTQPIIHITCIALLFLCSLSVQLYAQATDPSKIDMGDRFQINKDASYVNFETTFAGFPVVRGAFSGYQAQMFYDPDHIDMTSTTIRLDASTMSTAHPKRDAELLGAAFMDVQQFPAIWFTSTKVTETPSGLDLTGNLNIKNINKEVVLKITKPTVMRKAMGGRDIMMAKGEFTFKRSDFDLGKGSDYPMLQLLGDEVKVTFAIVGANYTLDYLKQLYVKENNGIAHPVGAVYTEVKANGLKSGMKKMQAMAKDKNYSGVNWQSALANLGWILMVDGYGKEAVEFFELALKNNPSHMVSLLRLGDAYVIAGEYDKALAHYRKERSLPERARFTHIPEMIKQLSGNFTLNDMK